ncbi:MULTISPECIES: hypothetical protein [Kribbella]|uniref:hypothetical protein n=1 Tax=Kribbella TaxID=182639 RepID=UPI0010536C24|nr:MULTISPECIES: hypothetical protein [Kribbella]
MTTALSGITGWSVTKTTAVYNGAPTAALESVQHMIQLGPPKGGRATGYASLIAVRNKLRECGTGPSHAAVGHDQASHETHDLEHAHRRHPWCD